MNDEILKFLVGKPPQNSNYDDGASTSSPRQRTSSIPSTPQSQPSSYSTPHRGSVRGSYTPKSIRKLCDSFTDVLENDWFDIDSTAWQLLRSIANLRERLWHGSRFQKLLEDGSLNDSTGGGLNRQDLDLMMDHDLIQHEKMLTQLRRTMAQLAQSQDALGRRLDECFRCIEEINQMDEAWLEKACNLYKATAQELYRKQVLAQNVLRDAGSSGLLGENVPDEIESPRQVAKSAAEKWSRSCKESHLCGLDTKALKNK